MADTTPADAQEGTVEPTKPQSVTVGGPQIDAAERQRAESSPEYWLRYYREQRRRP